MKEQYNILQGSHVIGQALVKEEGLYYRFLCSCQLTGDVMCKVQIRCGNNIRQLGILAPKEGMFCLETRIPKKMFGSGELRFELIPHIRCKPGQFIPICPEEPFAYLSRMRKAHMESRDGKLGIIME